MEGIIGKKYIASDNSYCLNLSLGDDYRLAGTMHTQHPKVAVIVSDPYKFNVNSCTKEKVSEVFVNVEYNGDVIRTLYHKNNVDANLEERIRRKNELEAIYLLNRM